MKNADAVVKYVLGHVEELTPEKISALADVIAALGGEVEKEPNTLKENADPNLLDEEEPVDLSKVTGIVVDGNERKVKIYPNE